MGGERGLGDIWSATRQLERVGDLDRMFSEGMGRSDTQDTNLYRPSPQEGREAVCRTGCTV